MLITSDSNKSACEVCGECPEDTYRRNAMSRNSGYRYAKTRHNRVRLEWLPARVMPLYGAWIGKLLCPRCYAKVSTALADI